MQWKYYHSITILKILEIYINENTSQNCFADHFKNTIKSMEEKKYIINRSAWSSDNSINFISRDDVLSHGDLNTSIHANITLNAFEEYIYSNL